MTRLHYASTQDPNILYFLRDHVADPFFFLEYEGTKRVFLSVTDLEAVREKGNGEVEVVDVRPLQAKATVRAGDQLGNLALVILEEYGALKDEIVIPRNFPVGIADEIRKTLPRLTAVTNWAPERELKSPEEISAIRENFKHTVQAYQFIEQILRDSVVDELAIMYDSKPLTSEFLKREVRKLLLDHDLENPAGLIISSGRHAAMPHHSGTGPIRPGETIIVDIFPQSTENHYFADMTRTYVKGETSETVKKMYAAVSEAQHASLAALGPGVSTKSVYEISAQVIRDHGFDVGEKGYTHSLGHGLGVAIHEFPNLSPRSDTTLEVGHVVTVEPGLYYPEHGGVRIEDTVVITEGGYENLTNYQQNWLL